MTPLGKARLIALLVPAALLAGAYGSQHIGGLAPCEMCYWQRYAHWTALALALASLFAGGRVLVLLAALAVAVSGGIGVYHAGVEAGIFEGFTQCTAAGGTLAEILARPVVRCDQVQWELFGISMAGWNAILSLSAALTISWLSLRRSRIPA
jgi:disulfide bond formation protein DsbB